jgi:DNA-binding MarR family transcriptional regulator
MPVDRRESMSASSLSRPTSTASPRPAKAAPGAADAGLREMAGQCICGNLRMAARLVTAHYDAALRPAGIEANQMAMLWVIHSGGSTPARDVARAAGMDQSTASRNLALLEVRGLIETRAPEEDRRRRLVRLTRKGEATLQRAWPRWLEAQRSLAEASADLADLAAVGRLLRKVARRMQDGDRQA